MIFNKKAFIDPLKIEKAELTFYIKCINEGDIILDVGANLGTITLLFSQFAGENGVVHAFEPTPSTFEKLSQNVFNMNRKNIILNNLAVSDSVGEIIFNTYEDAYASWNTIANRPLEKYGINIQKPVPIKIPTTTIDEYCEINAIKKLDFVKIDVEGAELSVLKGAKGMFSSKKIKYCSFEFGQTIFDMGNTVNEFIELIDSFKYKVYNVSKQQKIFPVNYKNMAEFSVLYLIPK